MSKAREIRARRADGALLRELSAEFGVNVSRIKSICRGEAWAELAPGASVFARFTHR